jgi:hypothetical protein
MPFRKASFWNYRNVACAVLLISAIILIALRFWFLEANSATADELVHVESGYRYWQCGDYGVSLRIHRGQLCLIIQRR